MNILKKVIGSSKATSDLIPVSIKVNRDMHKEFKAVVSLMGKTQKEMLEDYIQRTVIDFNAGRLN